MPTPQLKRAADWLWYLFCGCCMGAADIVPGVSGGTMAFILGFYEDLITNVKSINFKVLGLILRFRFKELSEHIAWQFLCILVIGILSAIAALSQVIAQLLNDEVYRVYLYSAFLGLILASVIFCARKVEVWNLKSVIALIVGGLAAYSLTNVTLVDNSDDNGMTYRVAISSEYTASKVVSNYDAKSQMLINVESTALPAMLAKGYVTKDTTIVNQSTGKRGVVGDIVTKPSYPIVLPWIIFCGAIGISAMLLPGISGSYLLTILGTYPLIVSALADLVSGFKHFQLDGDAVILLSNLLVGIVIGAALFSRLISWLFTHYHHATIALLVGFMIGALRAVWPFWSYSYQLIPVKLDKGPILISVAPLIPDVQTPLFWIAVAVTVVAFISVFLIEIIALRKHPLN
jgi:putative membrane protein